MYKDSLGPSGRQRTRSGVLDGSLLGVELLLERKLIVLKVELLGVPEMSVLEVQGLLEVGLLDVKVVLEVGLLDVKVLLKVGLFDVKVVLLKMGLLDFKVVLLKMGFLIDILFNGRFFGHFLDCSRLFCGWFSTKDNLI